MIMKDVVLYNEYGCELARETLTNEKGYYEATKDWIILPGDKIEIVETWHEEF